MNELSVRILDRAADIPAALWTAVGEPGHPFLNADFLRILEAHDVTVPDKGWQPVHLLASQGGAPVGLLPLYLKSHSHGDFIYDWNWRPVWERLGRRYYPRLLSGLPYTPVAGPRLLVAPHAGDADAVRHALIAGAKQLVDDHNLSTWHVALAAGDDCATLKHAGLLLSHDVQFHWSDAGFGDFDGFLRAFSAEKRRKVRAERRRAAASGLRIEVRHGGEVPEAEWPALHALYRSTFDRFGNYAAFSAECLAELARTLDRRMVVFTASDGERPVALSLCFRSDDTLFGRYWGAQEQVDSLHFELCFYRGIEYCLETGLTRFEPGAGGEHKIARGFTPRIVQSAHWIPDERLREVLADHLARQQSGVAAYREDVATHLPYRQTSVTL